MGRNLGWIAMFLTVFALLGITGCKNKETSPLMQADPNVPPAGELNVTFANPADQTAAPHEAEQIVVMFDHPMVPLEELPEGEGPAMLTISPKVPGKYRWLGSKAMTFTPSKRFPYSQEITITIPAGIRSLDNYALSREFQWSFKTIRPKLASHFPSDNQRWVKLDSSVLLVFNQPVDPDGVKEFLSLIQVDKADKESAAPFSLRQPNAQELKDLEMSISADVALILKPEGQLKTAHSYYVEARSGLPGKEGPLGMEKSAVFQFETFEEFAFLELDLEGELNPTVPLQFSFSNPVTYKDLLEKIRFIPEITIPDYYFSWDHAESYLWLNLPFAAETEYEMIIPADVEDNFGNLLGKEERVAFKTGSFPPSIYMTTGHGIIESYSDLLYPVWAVNKDEIFFQAASIGKDQIIPLLKSEKLFWNSERFVRPNFFQVEKPVRISLPRNERGVFPLELRELTKEGHGLIFVQLDTYAEEKWDRYPKALLQATELGITGKFSPADNSIWVTNLKSGLPVENAVVEIRDDRNKLAWSGTTDAEGHVRSPGWKRLGIRQSDEWSKPEQWVLVSKGEDVAFLSSEWGTGISPYRFGIEYEWDPQPERISGTIFTDRGIYRAGETVHIKSILREWRDEMWHLLAAENIECLIEDPFSKSAFKQTLDLDEFSSLNFDFTPKEDAPLGTYNISLTIPSLRKGEDKTRLWGSFRVEAFRPAEFEVVLKSKQDSYIFGDAYAADIRGNYMFGGVMAGQKAAWYLRLNPTFYVPPGHRGYVFGNELDRWDSFDYEPDTSRLLSSSENDLDSSGLLHIEARLKAEEAQDSALAVLEATVEGPSRRSISSRIQTVVHRGEYYLGLKPSTTFMEKGEDISVDVISVLPDGRISQGQRAAVKLIKREWQSVKKAEIGSRFRWITEAKDTVVDEKRLQTGEEARAVTFTPDKAGFYILKAEGKDGRGNPISTSTSFYVTGGDYVPWERQDDDTIELVADMDNYAPGDTAKILVKSPFESAKAMVTVERESIFDVFFVDVDGSSTQIDIPIKSEHIPNMYVSVLLVKGRTPTDITDSTEDLGKPSFKIGYIKLSVDPSEKRLSVEVLSDKETYKPGDRVTLRVSTKNARGLGTASSVAVAVADLGVLNLIGYRTPDPFSLFFQEKPLSVQTSENRQHLVGQRAYSEKGEDAGGGAGERMMASKALGMSEIELRGNFKSTAYWNPSIVTDGSGQASVSFDLPDNLTSFRIMAVAQTKDSRFGRGESLFRISKPLLIQAALPRFARVGDQFKGGIVIQNQSPETGRVLISCEVSGILLEDSPTREITIPSGSSEEVLFQLRAEKKGDASFSFRAKLGEDTDGLSITIPIHFPRPTETVALSDRTSESKEERIRIPDNVFLSETRLDMQGSASALTGLKGTIEHLYNYPYMCLEQRLSRVVPFIVGEDVIRDFRLSRLSPRQIKEFVQGQIKEVYAYQKDSGGFGLWPQSRLESPFNSCYAAFTLIQARNYGYDVSQVSLDRAAGYLKNLLRGRINQQYYPFSSRAWNVVKAYALYCLALFKQPEPGFADNLYAESEQMTAFGKTLLLKALKLGGGSAEASSSLLRQLMNTIKVTSTTAHFEDESDRTLGWIYSSNTRTTAFTLQSLIETGEEHELMPAMARWLVERIKTNRRFSTHENFYVFYALNDYYKKYERETPDFKIAVSLAGKVILEDLIKGDRNKVVSASESLEGMKEGRELPLLLNFSGTGTFYYDTRMIYAPKGELKPRDEGFTIFKTISAQDGTPLEEVAAGSMVMVTLTVVVPQERLYVVVDDPLPAGLEAVNPDFVTSSEEDIRQMASLENSGQRRWWVGFNHTEMRDDRILLFADSLPPGIYTHRYLARALTFGTFLSPGTKAEQMYAPEIFGRSSETTLRVK
jgi:uncharacterized protein YfaS (alpha-2-macroglobulin family)